ncbi:uracil-DNA glycosylase [Malacoplasma penetrans HF-2]|uniref:Uracil-DNA glycosylase n=2 Tax=Malacoplasma penetrans TaxID=28227 RepID=Q8EWJ6_MALP2|nr:uracil-DNA glycosylase [Malacoplasma penetrans HF-2]
MIFVLLLIRKYTFFLYVLLRYNELMYLNKFISEVKDSWKEFFEQEFEKEYFHSLDSFIEQEYKNKTIYPLTSNIFRAFTFFAVSETNLVIIGQDPYQTEDMADGLAFSTQLKVKPRSLSNIFKELKNDFNIDRTNYDLSDIAKQNVLLLNTILTVEKNKSFSHSNKGWEIFTNNAIKYLSETNPNVIYLLMGNNAISLKPLISKSLAIFETSHPSPFSYRKSLMNSKVFKEINKALITNNKKAIIW